jgi:hypothetical protein
MNLKPPRKGYVYVEVTKGVEGPSLSVGNDAMGERCAGPKPWGGGTTIHRFEVKADDLIRLVKAYGVSDKCVSDGGTCGLGGQCAECPNKESGASE